MRPLRVGVIGLGRIAQLRHLPLLAESSETRLVAVSDLSPSVVNAIGDRYRVPVATTRYEEILDRKDIDAVVVCTQCHDEIVLAAMGKGLPVLVEKPLSWSLSGVKRIAEAARRSGVPIAVGYMKRHTPVVEELKEEFKRSAPALVRVHNFAGDLKLRYAELPPVLRCNDDAELGIRAQQEGSIVREVEGTVGALGTAANVAYRFLLDLVAHDLAFVATIIGLPTRVEFARMWFAQSSVLGPEWSGKTAQKHRLTLCSTLVFENGARLQLEAAAYFDDGREWDEQVSFFGERNVTVAFPFPFAREAPISITYQPGLKARPFDSAVRLSYGDSFRTQLAVFVKAVRSHAHLEDVDLAVALTELIVRVVRAARDGMASPAS